jgi:hypothetical protein
MCYKNKIKRRYKTMRLRCRKATQYGNPLTVLTDDGVIQLNEGCVVKFEAEFKDFMYNPIDDSLVVVCNGKCIKHADGMTALKKEVDITDVDVIINTDTVKLIMKSWVTAG